MKNAHEILTGKIKIRIPISINGRRIADDIKMNLKLIYMNVH